MEVGFLQAWVGTGSEDSGRGPRGPGIQAAPAFLCEHLVFRFAECHQVARWPGLGETVPLDSEPLAPQPAPSPVGGLP